MLTTMVALSPVVLLSLTTFALATLAFSTFAVIVVVVIIVVGIVSIVRLCANIVMRGLHASMVLAFVVVMMVLGAMLVLRLMSIFRLGIANDHVALVVLVIVIVFLGVVLSVVLSVVFSMVLLALSVRFVFSIVVPTFFLVILASIDVGVGYCAGGSVVTNDDGISVGDGVGKRISCGHESREGYNGKTHGR